MILKTIPEHSVFMHVAPPRRLPLWQWAEANIFFPAKKPGNISGPFRLANAPYCRGIMDALDDPRIEMVIVMAASQTAKTTVGFIWVYSRADIDAGPTIIAYPNEDLARAKSQNECKCILEASQKLSHLMPRDLKTGWTDLQYRLTTCVVNFIGGNSASNMQARPGRYLMIDEVVSFPPEIKDVGDPINQLVQRTKAFPFNKKIYMPSSPRTPDDHIVRWYSRGDCRHFFVRCPHCMAWGFLKETQFKFDLKMADEESARSAHYECEFCKAPWTEREKNEAVAGGEWRATCVPKDSKIASFHLPSIYATWVTFEYLAKNAIRAYRNPAKEMQSYKNNEWAEPFYTVDAKVRDNALMQCEADYPEGFAGVDAKSGAKIAPFDAPCFRDTYGKKVRQIFGGADKGRDYIQLVIREFTEDGDSALMYKGRVSNFSEWDRVMAYHECFGCLFDARYQTNLIYAAGHKYEGIWYSKGVPARVRSTVLWRGDTYNIDENYKEVKEKNGREVTVINFDSNMLADMLFDRIMRAQYAPAWFIFKGASADDDYVSHMTRQYRDKGQWINPDGKPDHFWDAERLCLLAAETHGFGMKTLAENNEETQDGGEE